MPLAESRSAALVRGLVAKLSEAESFLLHKQLIFGPPFVKRSALCLSVCPSVCNVGLLRPNGWTDQINLGTEVDLDPGHIVLDRDPDLPQKGHSPNFRPISVVANG